ncbi:hypothetical protein TWF225_010610 [Orbilia oligospora]|nr:hypothetical protein TWF225_010610 [Orbilia oligospora]
MPRARRATCFIILAPSWHSNVLDFAMHIGVPCSIANVQRRLMWISATIASSLHPQKSFELSGFAAVNLQTCLDHFW